MPSNRTCWLRFTTTASTTALTSAPSVDSAVQRRWRYGPIRAELLELLPLLGERVTHLHSPLGLLQPVPLLVHASYTREEVLAGFGASTVTAPLPLQTGVYWHEATGTDLFFVSGTAVDVGRVR